MILLREVLPLSLEFIHVAYIVFARVSPSLIEYITSIASIDVVCDRLQEIAVRLRLDFQFKMSLY
jgi:hypothetical protein